MKQHDLDPQSQSNTIHQKVFNLSIPTLPSIPLGSPPQTFAIATLKSERTLPITPTGRPKVTALLKQKLEFLLTKRSFLKKFTSPTSEKSRKKGRKTSKRTGNTTSKSGVSNTNNSILDQNRHKIRDYVQARGDEYNREEHLAIIRTIQKNTLNNKILNKRVVGGS
jgi:hypothetical protein